MRDFFEAFEGLAAECRRAFGEAFSLEGWPVGTRVVRLNSHAHSVMMIGCVEDVAAIVRRIQRAEVKRG